MPYAKRKSKLSSRRKSYRSLPKTLAVLDRKINSLSRTYHKSLKQQMYGLTYGPVNLASPFTSVNLCNFNAATLLFGTDSDETHVNRARHRRMTVDMTFSPGNETSQIGYTIYLVSLRRGIPDAMYDSATGALSINGTDDYYLSQGMSHLNPKRFKVHRSKRFVISNEGVSWTTPSGFTIPSHRRLTWTLYPNHDIVNKRPQDVKELVAIDDPTKQYYLICFNDNSAVDGEYNNLQINIVHHITST